MRNFTFYFLCILFLHVPFTLTSLPLIELDYYAFFIQANNIIICSEKEYVKSNLILNEFENENGYTCLLNLKKNGIFRITLHVSQIEDKTGLYSEMIKKSLSKSSKSILQIGLGKSAVLKKMEIDIFKQNKPIKKQFLIKLDHGKVTYLHDNNCDFRDLDKCVFMDTKDALFMKKYIKVNFEFKEPNVQEITLLEKSTSSKLIKSYF